MTKQILLKVLVPAMTPNQGLGLLRDPTPVYQGMSMPNGLTPVRIGPAIVHGGTKVGNKWLSCTYTNPPFEIPGFGEIEEL